jgi:hypothetical protein
MTEPDHTYVYNSSIVKSSVLEVAVDALNFYEIFVGLSNNGYTKFITKSKLPTSIGLGNLAAKQMERLGISNDNHQDKSLYDDATLKGHLEGFGLSKVPVEGDGNCFFYAVAFQLLK